MFEGLSLSCCVRDIVEGKIKKEDVNFLVIGTKYRNDFHWEEVLEIYKKYYWKKNPKKGAEIANYFRNNGLIRQPRVDGDICHNISQGHWIKNGEQQRL